MGSVATLFMKEGLGHYKSERLEEKYPGIMFSQFMGAEMIVKKYGLTKDDLDAYALESHRRGKAATEAGHFKRELVGLEHDTHEGREMHLVDRTEERRESKSGAVRVDLGGGGIIKKNKK